MTVRPKVTGIQDGLLYRLLVERHALPVHIDVRSVAATTSSMLEQHTHFIECGRVLIYDCEAPINDLFMLIPQ